MSKSGKKFYGIAVVVAASLGLVGAVTAFAAARDRGTGGQSRAAVVCADGTRISGDYTVEQYKAFSAPHGGIASLSWSGDAGPRLKGER